MQRFISRGIVVAMILLAGCASGASSGLKEGWDLMLAADYAGARDHYEQMLTKYPDNAYVHLNLGVAYHQLGNADLARQEYEAAIKYGQNAPVTRVAEGGSVDAATTTVADKARENLKLLGQ